MDELNQFKELCEKMGPSKGEGDTLIAGRVELPLLFGLLGKVVSQIENRVQVMERSTMSQNRIIIDLLNEVMADVDAGKYAIKIDPKKYGFDTQEEYWRRIRELAGVPPKKG